MKRKGLYLAMFVLIAVGAWGVVGSTGAAATLGPNDRHPVGTYTIDSDSFYNWDFTTNANNPPTAATADMPVTMIFSDNATVNKVKVGIGFQYAGDPMYARMNGGSGWFWDSDKGIKSATCGAVQDTHIRIYANPNGIDGGRSYNPTWHYYTIATTHYDKNDCPGSTNKSFGWSEDAAGAIDLLLSDSQPTWTVYPDHTALGNGITTNYWIGDHYYQNDGKADLVVVP